MIENGSTLVKIHFKKINAAFILLLCFGLIICGYSFKFTEGLGVMGYMKQGVFTYGKELFSSGSDDDIVIFLSTVIFFMASFSAFVYIFARTKVILAVISFFYVLQLFLLNLIEMSSAFTVIYDTIVYSENNILLYWAVCMILMLIALLYEWFFLINQTKMGRL